MSSCESKGSGKECCSTSQASAHSGECESSGGCSSDPAECMAHMWTQSFMCALKAVQVDILKKKIEKTMGADLEKGAEAVLTAMNAIWMAKLSEAEAKEQLKCTLWGACKDAK